MAGTKISALTAAAAFTGVEQVPINQGGTTKRYTLAQPVLLQPSDPTPNGTTRRLRQARTPSTTS